MRVLVIGCGYIGLPLAAELARAGHDVFGVRRTARSMDDLTHLGVQPIQADITRNQDLERLPENVEWVVNCVASGGGGVEDYRSTYLQGTLNLLSWMKDRQPARFVYTSSTSVYGQTDGSVVDETSPTLPGTATGQVLLETESVLMRSAARDAVPAVILRLAGIYGPGRGHWFKQFIAGTAVLEGNGGRMLNMIHRDDVIGAAISALNHGRPGEVYNVVDNEPVSQRDFFEWLAEQTGRALPPSFPGDSLADRKRGVTNKCVSNRKLREVLHYRCGYPTFREGYASEVMKLKAVI